MPPTLSLLGPLSRMYSRGDLIHRKGSDEGQTPVWRLSPRGRAEGGAAGRMESGRVRAWAGDGMLVSGLDKMLAHSIQAGKPVQPREVQGATSEETHPPFSSFALVPSCHRHCHRAPDSWEGAETQRRARATCPRGVSACHPSPQSGGSCVLLPAPQHRAQHQPGS